MKLNLLYCFGDEKYFHETMYMSVYIFLHLMEVPVDLILKENIDILINLGKHYCHDLHS